MTEVYISYGDGTVPVEVEEKRVNAVLEPNDVEVGDETEIIKKALYDPIGSPPVDDFLDDRTLFIVNDATRPTPTAQVLELLEEEIEDRDVRFIVAKGSHREPTAEEYREIFGPFYSKYRDEIYSHDAENDEMVDYGTTDRGTLVKFNRILDWARKIININSVEPHYFAGFTGGRKSLLPGIASYETIEGNHYNALSEGAKPLKLEDNPVHLDMMDAVSQVEKDIFSVNLTLDKDNRVYHASGGDLVESFLEETERAKEIFSVSLERRSDVVVTSAHPMGMNLYQSLKAFENGRLALKEGGIMILVAECGDGIGPRNFYDLLASVDEPEETLEKIEKEYRLGYQKTYGIAEVLSDSEFWAVTDLNDEILKKVFITPKSDIQGAVDEALAGKSGEITFLSEGSMVVPDLSL